MDEEDDEQIRYPTDYEWSDILAWRSFGMVFLKPESQIVVKSAHLKSYQFFLDAERLIYERFEQNHGHAGVLRYHGPYGDDDNSAIQLEYAPHGDLRTFLAGEREQPIDLSQRRLWALQLANALEFNRRVGVIHGDLSSSNIFLDATHAPKISDFSGSSLDGSRLLVRAAPSYAHPTLAGSPAGDRFAYGSILYEILTGAAPFAALEPHEIEDRFAGNSFPETTDLGTLGPIVWKCWSGQYSDTVELLRDVQGLSAE
jgi:serine/threonine protein kinase